MKLIDKRADAASIRDRFSTCALVVLAVSNVFDRLAEEIEPMKHDASAGEAVDWDAVATKAFELMGLLDPGFARIGERSKARPKRRRPTGRT
jgi:hypothetical protein